MEACHAPTGQARLTQGPTAWPLAFCRKPLIGNQLCSRTDPRATFSPPYGPASQDLCPLDLPGGRSQGDEQAYENMDDRHIELTRPSGLDMDPVASQLAQAFQLQA